MLSFNERLYSWWMKQNILVGILTAPLIYVVFGCLFALEFAIFNKPAASLAFVLAVLMWKHFYAAVEIRAAHKKARA